MPDNVLRVGAEFDVGPLVASTQTAVSAFERLQATAAKMAAQLIADGESATAVSSALLNFGFSAQTVTAAMESLGLAEKEVAVSTEAVTASMTGFDRAAAMAGGRILGMEVGLGMAGGALGRVAAFLPGMGTLFEIALPIALITAVVEKIEEFEKQVEAAREGQTALAISTSELTGKIEVENLKLDDQIAKFEHHPEKNMPKEAAIEATIAFQELGTTIDEDLKKLAKFLEEGTGFWSALWSGAGNEEAIGKALDPIQRIYQIAVAANNVQAQKNELLAAEKVIQDAIAKEQQKKIYDMLQVPGQPLTFHSGADQKALQDYGYSLEVVQNALKALGEEQENVSKKAVVAGLEATKAIDDYYKEYSAGFSKTESELARHAEMWKKFFADQVIEQQRSVTERAKIEEEGQKQITEQTDRAYEHFVSTNIEGAKAEAAAIEDVMRKMQEQRSAADTGHSGVFKQAIDVSVDRQQMQELDTEIAHTEEIMQRLKDDMQLIANQPFISEADQTQLNRYNEELKSLESLLQKLETEHTKLGQTAMTTWQKIGQAEEQSLNKGFETFNSQFVRMMSTGQSFSKVMISAWNSMVGSFVTDVLKMGEQWIATEILKLTATTTTNSSITANTLANNLVQRFDNAKTAAAKAMASTPFPLDLAVGPLVFAAALAFAEGGIVPGYGAQPAIVHGGERVLTGAQNQTLERIANSTTNSSQTNVSMENHFHKTGDMTESAIARNFMRGVKRGSIQLRSLKA